MIGLLSPCSCCLKGRINWPLPIHHLNVPTSFSHTLRHCPLLSKKKRTQLPNLVKSLDHWETICAAFGCLFSTECCKKYDHSTFVLRWDSIAVGLTVWDMQHTLVQQWYQPSKMQYCNSAELCCDITARGGYWILRQILIPARLQNLLSYVVSAVCSQFPPVLCIILANNFDKISEP